MVTTDAFIIHSELTHKVYSLMRVIKTGQVKGKEKIKAKNKVVTLMKILEKLDSKIKLQMSDDDEIKTEVDHPQDRLES